MTILFIDDEVNTNAAYYVSALEVFDHIVLKAENPEEALDVIKQSNEDNITIDLIILDMMMPNGGLSAGKNFIIDSKDNIKKIPIIILTILDLETVNNLLSEVSSELRPKSILLKKSTPPGVLCEKINAL